MSDRTKAKPIDSSAVDDQRWGLIDRSRRDSFASEDDFGSSSVRFDVPNVGPPAIRSRRNILKNLLQTNKSGIKPPRISSNKDDYGMPMSSGKFTSGSRKHLSNGEKSGKHKVSGLQRDISDAKSSILSQKLRRPGTAAPTRVDSSLTNVFEQGNDDDRQAKTSMKWEANPLVIAALNDHDLGSSGGSVAERQAEQRQLASVLAALESAKFEELNDDSIMSPTPLSPTPLSPTKSSAEATKQPEIEGPYSPVGSRRNSDTAIKLPLMEDPFNVGSRRNSNAAIKLPAMQDPFNVRGRRNSNTLNLGSRTPPRSPRGAPLHNHHESIENSNMPSEISQASHGSTPSSVPFADKYLYAKRPSISLPTNRCERDQLINFTSYLITPFLINPVLFPSHILFLFPVLSSALVICKYSSM